MAWWHPAMDLDCGLGASVRGLARSRWLHDSRPDLDQSANPGPQRILPRGLPPAMGDRRAHGDARSEHPEDVTLSSDIPRQGEMMAMRIAKPEDEAVEAGPAGATEEVWW